MVFENSVFALRLREPVVVRGPVNLSGLGDIEGPVVAGRPVDLENSAFTLRLVDAGGPVDINNGFNCAPESTLP